MGEAVRGRAGTAAESRAGVTSGQLRELDPERLLYESTKPGSGRIGPLLLTPLELLDRLAALVPPRRVHRHLTSACWLERPLTGNFCGDRKRHELARRRPLARSKSRHSQPTLKGLRVAALTDRRTRKNG